MAKDDAPRRLTEYSVSPQERKSKLMIRPNFAATIVVDRKSVV
jgi:hypothetical protein